MAGYRWRQALAGLVNDGCFAATLLGQPIVEHYWTCYCCCSCWLCWAGQGSLETFMQKRETASDKTDC